MKKKLISALSAAGFLFSSVPAGAVILDEEQIYYEKVIYNLDFAGADTENSVYKSETDSEKSILRTWQPSGLSEKNIFSAIGGVNEKNVYGVVIEPDIKDNDEILKLSDSSDSNSSYADIQTDIANEDYYISDDGVLSVSFDFYANGSYMLMRTGRTIGEDSDGVIHKVKDEGQRFLEITKEAKLVMFGSKYGETLQLPMYEDEEQTQYGQDNKWHTLELVMRADNKYGIVFDGTALNGGEWLTFDTVGTDDSKINCTFGEASEGYTKLSFRGFSTLRIYNGHSAASSTHYYDNFRYAVYDNVTEEYQLPSISFTNTSASVINLEEGEEYTLNIKARTVCPDVIKVYADDELAAEIKGDSCDYTYTAQSGMHTVSAEVYDTEGAVSERCTVTFIVSEKIEINGSFSGGATNGTYNESDEKAVLFETECINGLERVEFYVNGRKVLENTEAVTVFDFSEQGAGTLSVTAVVYDTEGKSKSFSYTANVALNNSTLLWNEDFVSYTDEESSSVGSNVNFNTKNGYHRPVCVDDEHGTSLALGIEQDNGSDTGAYVNFVNPKETQHIVFETEFYISDYPAEGEARKEEIHFDMYESGSVQNAVFSINSSDIYKGSEKISYEKEKWYKLKMDFDIPNKRYSVYIDGTALAENVDLSAEKSTFLSLKAIRCYGPGVADIPCFIAFDNAKITLLESHGITDIVNDGSESEISTLTKTIRVKLSQGLLGESLNTERVKVYGENGNLHIKNIEYNEENSEIIITLSDSFLAGKQYSVWISGDAVSDTGNVLGTELSKSFYVINDSAVNIDSAEHKNGILSLYLSGNHSETTEAYVVVTAWSGKKYLGMTIQKATLSSNVEKVTVETDFSASAQKLEIYIVDSLINANMMVNDIYTLKTGN